MTRSVDAIVAELEQRDLLEMATRVASHHHVTLREMLGTSRVPPLPAARREFWTALNEIGMSSVRIGKLAGRDHSTVLVGVRKRDEERGAA